MAQRSNRAEETRERRRKPGQTVNYGVKLHVPEDEKDPTKEYRWVNDTPGRIEALYAQDWTPVSGEIKPDADGEGSVVSKHVGLNGASPMKAVLMAKPKDWHEADQREKRKPLDEMDEAIRKGTAHKKSGEAELSGVTYTPEGTVNSVSR